MHTACKQWWVLSFSNRKPYPESPRASISGFFMYRSLDQEKGGKNCASNAEATAGPVHNPSQKPKKNYYLCTPVASTAEAVYTTSV